jgi:hypothetical protein
MPLIEEEFLDEKSNGFQLERSEIRSAPALSRLCLVMAVALSFVSQPGHFHKLQEFQRKSALELLAKFDSF